MDILTTTPEENRGNKEASMEKRFYKTYPNDNRLEISFLAGLPPIIAKDTTPDNSPNEEMKRDKSHFESRRYNENLLTELQQRGFSEDV